MSPLGEGMTATAWDKVCQMISYEERNKYGILRSMDNTGAICMTIVIVKDNSIVGLSCPHEGGLESAKLHLSLSTSDPINDLVTSDIHSEILYSKAKDIYVFVCANA